MIKFLGVATVAILLAMVSPFMAAVDDGPVLQAWLQWLPVRVDQIVLPDGERMMLALAMVVLAVQYLLVFLLVMPLRPLLCRFLNIISAPLRRGFPAHWGKGYRPPRPGNNAR